MLRNTVRTLFDRVLDLPWLLADGVRHAASTVRRRSPDALDAVARPIMVGGLARKLTFSARRTALAAADAVGGLSALMRPRRFRPFAPRVLALVGTPIATVALVLVVAAQAPSLVRAGDQGVLAVSMGVEEPAAAAVLARSVETGASTAAPGRRSALPRVATARTFPKVSRPASAAGSARQATAKPDPVRQATTPAASARPRATAAPRSSARKASPFAPKAAPRARTTVPPAGASPRQPKRSGGGEEAPKGDDAPKGGGGGGETPKEDDRRDDDNNGGGGDNGGGGTGGGGTGGGGGGSGGGGGDDDRGDRDRDDDDDDDDDRGKGEKDHDLDDRDRDEDDDDDD